MFDGSELEIAIAMVLAGAVCLGFLLHLLWQALGGSTTDAAEREEMALHLHEADLAREAAEAAQQEAAAALARCEADAAEQLAVLQARLDGETQGREAELERELSEARSELETLRGGLSNARRRNQELEAEIEKLRGAGE
jgi:chromosome segregation ATPase